MTFRLSLICAVAGLIAWIVGASIDAHRAMTAYLFAYVFVVTIVLGALFQVMMSHLAAARWFVVLRRVALAITATLPALALLAIPLLPGLHALYPGAIDESLAAAHRRAWLDLPFFVARGAIYFAVWIIVAERLRRSALAQDGAAADAMAEESRRARRWSAAGAVVVGLTFTFAVFDAIMSLGPAWYSTIFGVYVFAGSWLAALALIAVLASRSAPDLVSLITIRQLTALGTLLFSCVLLWTYLAFSQFLIIWIADIPREADWFVIRTTHGWRTVAYVLLAGQFALPFLLLLSKRIKGSRSALGLIGAWLVLMHAVECYWLVVPARNRGLSGFNWLDIAALAAVCGSTLAAAAWRARGYRWVPLGDPYLEEAIK